MEARCGCGLWGMGKGSSLLNSKNYVKHFTCFLPGTDFTITWVDSHIPSYTSQSYTQTHYTSYIKLLLQNAQSFVQTTVVVALFYSTVLSLYSSVLSGVRLFFLCVVPVFAHLYLIYSCVDCLLYVINIYVAPWSWRYVVAFHCVLYGCTWLE